MKVKVLIEFKDLKSNKVRPIGEIFEVNKKRFEELISNPFGTLVEEIREVKKETIDNG